jgi:hypothetical protein
MAEPTNKNLRTSEREEQDSKRKWNEQLLSELNSYLKPEHLDSPYSPLAFREIYEGRQNSQSLLEEKFNQQNLLADIGLVEYTKKNYDKIIDGLEDKYLLSLLMQTPLEKTKDGKYNEIIDILDMQKNILKAKGNSELSKDYLNQLLGKDEESWINASIEQRLDDSYFVQGILNAYFESGKKYLEEKVHKKNLKSFIHSELKKHEEDPMFLTKLATLNYKKLIEEDANNGKYGLSNRTELLKSMGFADSIEY